MYFKVNLKMKKQTLCPLWGDDFEMWVGVRGGGLVLLILMEKLKIL